jgi:hypothetical protein
MCFTNDTEVASEEVKHTLDLEKHAQLNFSRARRILELAKCETVIANHLENAAER